ncbi:hypothetical protein, partial [Staphylococcus aureus]
VIHAGALTDHSVENDEFANVHVPGTANLILSALRHHATLLPVSPKSVSPYFAIDTAHSTIPASHVYKGTLQTAP